MVSSAEHRTEVHGEVKKAIVGFFSNGSQDPTSQARVIEEHLASVDRNLGADSPSLLTAGALAAGFTIETDPPSVIPPVADRADAVLDQGILMQNDYLIVPTLIDMAFAATSRGSKEFNEGIVVQVRELGL